MTVNVGLDWTAPRGLLSLIAYSGKQPRDIIVKEKAFIPNDYRMIPCHLFFLLGYDGLENQMEWNKMHQR